MFIWAWLMLLFFFFSVHLGISGILWFKFKFNCSLLVYRKEIAFLNINSVILQPCYNHLLVQEFFFFCRFVWIFYIDNHIIWNKESFIASFPIYIQFISFSCLIALARPLLWYWKGVVRGDILALCLTLVGKLYISHHWVQYEL